LKKQTQIITINSRKVTRLDINFSPISLPQPGFGTCARQIVTMSFQFHGAETTRKNISNLSKEAQVAPFKSPLEKHLAN
jgi:hypothetical protein